MNFDFSKIEKSSLDLLNKNSINFFDFINNKIISCCESELNIFDLDTKVKSSIYSVNEQTNEELGCFEIFNQDKLFLSNHNLIQLFDLNVSKQINKFKFAKDTINSIRTKQNNILACCDDSGEIKLLDIRLEPNPLSLSLRKSLNQHENICYALEFHPVNEHELFSGSFDCTFIKWDIRFNKKDSKKPYVKKVAISDEIQKLIQIQTDSADMLSSMTPSFIHSLYFTDLEEGKMGLMCGIENGYTMLFNPDNCKLIDGKQITNNLAVSQFSNFEKINDKNLIATSGDSKIIEFVYTNKKDNSFKTERDSTFELNKFKELSIKHNKKVNCLRYRDQKFFISDTSNDITILNFENFLNKS